MKIVYVTGEPFPNGGAATNRIRSLSNGLSKIGNELFILILKPFGGFNNNLEGTIDGYRYKYATKISNWEKKNSVIKIYHVLYGIVNSAIILKQLNKEKIDVIILVSNSPIYIFYIFILSRLFRIKFIQEKSEFPFVLMKKKFYSKVYAKFYVNIIYKLFDGMIVMTKTLKEYFRTKVRRKIKLAQIPMTVEYERFQEKYDSVINKKYIAYTGSLGGSKDGVDILIESFSYFNSIYPDYLLLILGSGPEKDLLRLNEIVIKYKLEEKVIFTGYISRERIPEYLCNAKMLVLCRPTSLQSSGGFPTKLGEYLSTGKPVVVTNVGDIPYYLKDNLNAFISAPNDSVEFSKKMIEVLENYDRSLAIGQNGKETARLNFSHKVQATKLENYLQSIL